jgi:hypothetical protein
VLARVLKDAPKLESGKLGASVLAGWGWAGPIPYARGVMDVLLENGAFRLDEGLAAPVWRLGLRGIVRSWQKGDAITQTAISPPGDVVERGCTSPARGATTGAPHQLSG